MIEFQLERYTSPQLESIKGRPITSRFLAESLVMSRGDEPSWAHQL